MSAWGAYISGIERTAARAHLGNCSLRNVSLDNIEKIAHAFGVRLATTFLGRVVLERYESLLDSLKGSTCNTSPESD